MKAFEINCDVGEHAGNDAALMPYLHACSIACGGHTGDDQSMRETVRLAGKHQVQVGAHPSFPDRENFGRKVMQMKIDDLITSVGNQIRSLSEICKEMNVRIEHVKPHGALYNLAAKDEETATAVVLAIKDLEDVILYAPWNSVIARVAKDNGLRVTWEGFADRRYTKDLALVSRDHPEAVISDPEQSLKQVLSIFHDHRVETIDGEIVEMRAETFCVHGDNPAAVDLVKKIRETNHAK